MPSSPLVTATSNPATRAWRYNAVAGTFWTDRGVRGLPEDGRALMLYLLTAPERVSEGFYVLSPALAASRLGWEPSRLSEAFAVLQSADMALFDSAAEVVFVKRGLKYNEPKGPSSIRGALKRLDEATDAPALFDGFLAAADRYAASFAQAIRDRYGLAPEGPS